MRKEGMNVARGMVEIEMGNDKNNLGSIALLLIFKSQQWEREGGMCGDE